MERIWLSSPHIGEKEKFYVDEAFTTNWIAPLGPNVDAFEEQLTNYLNVASVLSLNSGTAALHLALEIVGVQQEDVVLCQSFTFAASAFPITYLKGIPVFIDSENASWNMDPVLLEKAIEDHISNGKKPKAIIVVHLYGTPANMKEILAIAAKHDIPVIEDAAEALGSTYNKEACGSLGKIGVLSFNGNKIITTSGGGAFASKDVEMVTRARLLSAQAKENAPFYLHKHIGYNYRMSNICAGIGRGQMEVLHERVAQRRANFEKYKQAFSAIKGVSFPAEPENTFCNRWLTTVLFDKNVWPSGTIDIIREALNKEQIETRPLWKPLHQQPVFKDCLMYNNGVSDELFATGLCLPSGSNLSNESFDKVVSHIKNTLNEIQ